MFAAMPQTIPDLVKLQAEAEAQGYVDETCPKCGTVLKAYHHFIRCDANPCPMVSKRDPRTLLQKFIDGQDVEGDQ
jgi:hypothetical protein